MSKTAPKLMKLQLTDGQNTYSAIEMEPTALSLETRPGTKVKEEETNIFFFKKSPFFSLCFDVIDLVPFSFLFLHHPTCFIMSRNPHFF